jgi:DNA-binding NarL/FixJ family response regulator
MAAIDLVNRPAVGWFVGPRNKCQFLCFLQQRCRVIAELAERHEIQIRGHGATIVFTADSEDGRLVIRRIPDGKRPKDVCSITLADPDELRAFFKGLRRLVASLERADVVAGDEPAAARNQAAIGHRQRDEDREAVIAQAREKNAQAFAPWTKQEEEEVKKRFERGETVQHIARAHKRSPRAIELRLQRLNILPAP